MSQNLAVFFSLLLLLRSSSHEEILIYSDFKKTIILMNATKIFVKARPLFVDHRRLILITKFTRSFKKKLPAVQHII